MWRHPTKDAAASMCMLRAAAIWLKDDSGRPGHDGHDVMIVCPACHIVFFGEHACSFVHKS